MGSIKNEVRISSTLSKVYEALTQQAGYRGWWNAVAEVPERTGAEAELRFVKEGTPVNMRFRVDELAANQSVRWTCVGHDMPSWVGTTLNWSLKQSGDDVLVSFNHAGWKDDGPEPVAQGWEHFLGSLKEYVETGTGKPW